MLKQYFISFIVLHMTNVAKLKREHLNLQHYSVYSKYINVCGTIIFSHNTL